jgi:hypothetical protein
VRESAPSCTVLFSLAVEDEEEDAEEDEDTDGDGEPSPSNACGMLEASSFPHRASAPFFALSFAISWNCINSSQLLWSFSLTNFPSISTQHRGHFDMKSRRHRISSPVDLAAISIGSGMVPGSSEHHEEASILTNMP